MDNPDAAPPVPQTATEFALASQVEQLWSAFQALQQQQQQQQQQSSITAPHLNVKEFHGSTPPTFSGKRSDSETFVLKLDNIFSLQSVSHGTEEKKIQYAISLLTDDAFNWIRPHLLTDISDRPDWFATWPQFRARLLKDFGDIDRIETARRALKDLRQTTSASNYAFEYKRHMFILDFGDQYHRFNFFDGLKLDVKERIVRAQNYDNLDDLIDAAIKWDNALVDFRHAHTPRNVNRPTVVPVVPPARRTFTPVTPMVRTSFTGPVPMEVDATSRPRGPLSDAEKERRRRDGLCLYCASKGHQVINCPIAPRRSFYVSAISAVNTADSTSRSATIKEILNDQDAT
jgi:hypothetical protein